MTKICDFDDKMNYSGDYSSTGYARLAKSLIDIVKEQQAKLGYRKEKIRLYYPLSSLNHFFGNETDAAGMMEILKDFPS